MSTTIEMDSLVEFIPQVMESHAKRKKTSKTRGDGKNKGDAPFLASTSINETMNEHVKPTFESASLEKEFIAFCQVVAPVPVPASELNSKRLELLRQVSRPVYLQEFTRSDAAAEICGEQLLFNCDLAVESFRWIESDTLFASLCANRVLTVEEERSVFRRMNYFRYLAEQLLRSAPANAWQLTRAAGLVRAANWHRALIVQGNVRLIVSIVRKLPVHPKWHDELVSDGVVALLRAIDRFDPSRGYRFCTYATPVIRRDCFVRIRERDRDRVQSNRARRIGGVAALQSHKNSQSSRDFWITWREQLSELMNHLSVRERLVVRSRYALGSHKQVKTLQRLADVLKISKERVRQIEQRALSKLRAAAKNHFNQSQDPQDQIDAESDPLIAHSPGLASTAERSAYE